MRFFKHFVLVVFISVFSLPSWSSDKGEPVDVFFVQMPDVEIAYLNMSLKSEMVEFYKHNSSIKVRNLLGGESWISHIDSLQLDAVLVANKCFLTVKALEGKCGKRIYAVIKTVLTPIADSSIRFYDADAMSIDSYKLFNRPKFSDFFAKTKNKELKDVMDKITLMFLDIDVLPNGDLHVTMDDMWLDVLDSNTSKALLQIKHQAPLLYKWTGKRYKRVVN